MHKYLQQIPTHTETDCPLAIISCPYAQMGCMIKVMYISGQAAHAKLYKAKFWWKSYVKNLYILNVWEPIPLKLNIELGEWWKCNKVVLCIVAIPKLRFHKTRLRVQVFSSWRRQHVLPLIDHLKPLLCNNRRRL